MKIVFINTQQSKPLQEYLKPLSYLFLLHLFSSFNQFLQFIILFLELFLNKEKMGIVESKIQEGYRLHQTPVFESKINKGQLPEQSSKVEYFSHQQSTELSENTELDQEGEPELLHTASTKKLHVKLTKIVSTPRSYPFSTVGLIKSNIDGLEVCGTGTIIGKRHILTCAHNCYSIKNKKPTENLVFLPAFSSSKNGPSYRPKTIHLPASFQNSLEDDSSIENTIANDYALIELDTDDNLEATYGSLGIDFSDEFSDLEKEIIGYSKRNHRHSRLHCYKGEGHLQRGLIKYNMPASSGMGGSPIIEERDGYYFIIGLHVYCLEVDHSKQRGGLKMGQRVFEDMEKWMCQQVQTVDLREKNIEKEGLKYISKHNWKKLAHLTLVKCNLFSNAGKYLRKGNWAHLTHLDLGGNHLGKEGMQDFSQGSFPKLKSLSLWGNGICKGGVYYLTLSRLDSLENLNLYHNQLCDEGLEILCKGKWSNLLSLHLGNNSIHFNALVHLECTCWLRLQNLNLWGNGLQGDESIIKAQLKSNFIRLKSLTI